MSKLAISSALRWMPLIVAAWRPSITRPKREQVHERTIRPATSDRARRVRALFSPSVGEIATHVLVGDRREESAGPSCC